MFFYPKDDTPGCTAEAKAFQADLAQFQKLKAKVIGISSDEDHKDFVDKYGLKMTLLSDVGGKVGDSVQSGKTAGAMGRYEREFLWKVWCLIPCREAVA